MGMLALRDSASPSRQSQGTVSQPVASRLKSTLTVPSQTAPSQSFHTVPTLAVLQQTVRPNLRDLATK